ncbi:MAG: enoyl-CoA hydratase/isomerase family protein [Hyphomicrobium sp.]
MSDTATTQATTAAHATQTEPAKIEAVRRGALMRFVLNRPRALNAFDDDMRKILSDEIPKTARNPDIYICALTSASDRAFCAGGDVRALVNCAKTDMARARQMFAAEYQLDWLLDCFSKPTVSFINGLCMGSGAGLSSYNTHRVAGENYSFAMPETAIGLFPDVGVAHKLAAMPWPIGLYLGLTGHRVGRADAFWLGLVTHCIASSHFEDILDALSQSEPVDPLLDGLHQDQDRGELERTFPMIREYFSGENLAEILRALAGAKGEAKPWAESVLAELGKYSPTSLAITDVHIRACRSLDLRETLIQDFRIAWRCLEGNDFAEGVRAALIDKDNKPRWQPGKIDDVDPAEVARYFAPLGENDLALPTREQMQAARV